METKTPYSKTYKTPAELVSVLRSRGLSISDARAAARFIENVGYYRLSAYMYPFLRSPKTDHRLTK